MESETVKRLKEIAKRFSCRLELEEAGDGSHIDCVIRKQNLDLYIVVPKHDNYYAYGITSTALPREFYPDNVAAGFTEQARSGEIIATIEKILSKK